MRKAFSFLAYFAVRIFGGLINLLPLRLAFALASPIGTGLFYLLHRRRRVCLDNLRHAYGEDKTEKEIQEIARRSFVHLVEFAIEWVRLAEFARSPERHLSVRYAERLHDALKMGKGALILASHNGNWEIMALIVAWFVARPVSVSAYALARPLKNLFLYDHVIKMRGLTGMKSIGKSGAVREAFKLLRKNRIVCLLADQRVREGSVESTFFGRKALTSSLPAVAALRYGTPVFFVFIRRTKDLRYVMDVEPIPIVRTGNQTEDLIANTQAFNNRIEAEVRKDPSGWLWMHDRWRL